MAQLVNLIGSVASGGSPIEKLMGAFKGFGAGTDGLASMILNTQDSIQKAISGQLLKMTEEIVKLAVINANYVTTRAIGKDITGMVTPESILKSINGRMQSELKGLMDTMRKAIFKPIPIGPPITNPSGGGFKRAKTLRNISVVQRTKTHRRPAVVSKTLTTM
jgi:hypothetical protein